MFNLYDNIGKIIIVNNIVFIDKFLNRKVADHSSLTGRPCIIIDEIDDKMYLLPLTSTLYYGKFKKHQFIIHKFDIINSDFPKKEYVELTPIIKRDLFSGADYGELTPIAYYQLINSLRKLYNLDEHKKYLDLELYKEIEDSISDKIKKLEYKMQIKQDS